MLVEDANPARVNTVLYVGSGLSAKRAEKEQQKVDICCAVNNAWRVFEKGEVDYWIAPGDFPPTNYPPKSFKCQHVGYTDYKNSAENIFSSIGETYKFPQHHAGYTTFFQGLYWIFDTLKPKEVYLLGFDHDYDPQKVALWMEQGKPSPHNKYGGAAPVRANEWVNTFFEGCPVDSIYGHGTPDPLRLGVSVMQELFERAKGYANKLGIGVFNASGVTTGLNTFPQKTL
jgi:hypothetical protein